MKCLSPEQIALRAVIALEFGLLAATVGAAVTAAGVYLGASTLVASGVGFVASTALSKFLESTRELYLGFIEVAY